MRASLYKYTRPDEPQTMLWSDLRPRQKHSYSILLHNYLLTLQVASLCIDEYHTCYQIVETAEHGH